VGGYTLSRSLISSGEFKALSLHKSQKANFQGAGVINGDKVFWYRDTDSLCYQADIQVSSGNGCFLNDFMLLENTNLTEEDHLPYDGTWIPADEEKSVTVTFPQPQKLTHIRIYDNPSPEDNVLGGEILFPDGSKTTFGPLDPEGAVTTIPLDSVVVTDFTLVLTETEGEKAGLTELEAFSETPDHGMRFLKLVDNQDNFIYDYWIPTGSDAELGVYACGLTDEEQQNLKVHVDNQKCGAEFKKGVLRVVCPEGESVTLTVSVEGADLSDTVRIHNPGKLKRLYYHWEQTLEEQLFRKYCDGICWRSASLKLISDAAEILAQS